MQSGLIRGALLTDFGVGIAAALAGGPYRGRWSPQKLFATGSPGYWFDPSDLSTMFQDSAGTTPVTGAGQPVGVILDKSGNANHATQATAINRPTLQVDALGNYYLSFNGTNSWMGIADNAGIRKSVETAIAAIQPTQVTARQSILMCGSYALFSTNNYEFDVGNVSGFISINSRTPAATIVGGAVAAGQSVVAAFVADGANITQRSDGVQTSNNAGTLGTDNIDGATLGASRRTSGTVSFFYGGSLYGALVINSVLTDKLQLRTERWFAHKQGRVI